MDSERRAVLRSGGLVLASAIAGCSGSSGTGTGTRAQATIELADVSFNPQQLSVEVGTSVTWFNREAVAHNVRSATFNEGATDWDFQSSRLEQRDESVYNFDSEGVYEYYCGLHGQESMCGVVLVGDVEPAGPLPCGSTTTTAGNETQTTTGDDGAYDVRAVEE